jgi:hypothetical protein
MLDCGARVYEYFPFASDLSISFPYYGLVVIWLLLVYDGKESGENSFQPS